MKDNKFEQNDTILNGRLNDGFGSQLVGRLLTAVEVECVSGAGDGDCSGSGYQQENGSSFTQKGGSYNQDGGTYNMSCTASI